MPRRRRHLKLPPALEPTDPPIAATAEPPVVDPQEHETILERGSESPTFVFPLRRESGHFMLFSQFSAANRMFVLTYLEDYRQNPTMAQPWGSVHLFDELLETVKVASLGQISEALFEVGGRYRRAM